MQIISVHLKNIKSHRDTELSFSAGINVLSGPNGAGKSTIFEAIGYALFGVDARDFVSNVDRFLSIGTKKGEISVDFQTDDGQCWRVSRSVGAGAKWLLARESGGLFEVEDHARIEETEARIAGLLGLANGRPLSEQFKLVIGPFQNDFLGPFVIKQSTKRLEAFDEILGIDAWRKTYKGTSTLLSTVQERIKILTAEVGSKQDQLLLLQDKQAELTALVSEQGVKESGLKQQSAALENAEKLLLDLDRREKSISTLQAGLQLLIGRLTEGDEKIATQKIRVDEAHRAVAAVNEARAGKEACDRSELQLKELRQKEQQRRQVEREINALEKEAQRQTQQLEHERLECGKIAMQLAGEEKRLMLARQAAQADPKVRETAAALSQLRRDSDTLKASHALLSGRKAALLEGKDKLAEGVCPFFMEQCRNIAGTEPRDVFSARTADLDRQMNELFSRVQETDILLKEAEKAEKELNGLQVRLQEIDKQLAALEKQKSGHLERVAGQRKLAVLQAEAAQKSQLRKADLQAFAGLDGEIERAEQERASFQGARDTFNAHQKDAAELPLRIQLLEKMQQLLNTLKAERSASEGELAAQQAAYQPEQHRELRLEKDRLLSAVATLRQQIVELGRNRQRLESELERLGKIKAEVEEKQVRIASFEEKEKLVKFLRNQIFKNVSTQLSERFREEISLRADIIYRTIADSDEELNWGESYQIILRDMPDGVMRERSDDQLSGGQMMSAVVALRLALLQTIGARIAFFDEPTSNLDAARRENLAHAFRAIDVGREEVSEHWYDQLFLVSHDVSFTEITDQVVTVGEPAPI